MTFDSSDLPHPLQVALASDPGRPRLTFYDDESGERVELSARSLAGWVIKTMNLLIDDLGVDETAEVSLHLPLHWLTTVWVLAADAAGAAVTEMADPALPEAGQPLVVVDTGLSVEGFAVSLRPLAMPLGGDCPPGLRDFCAEVRTMPDQLVQPATGPVGRLAGSAPERATALGLLPGDRVALSSSGSATNPLVAVDGLLAALSLDGSAVWTRNPDPAACVSRWRAEQVTALLGPLPAGFAGPIPGQIRHLSPGTP